MSEEPEVGAANERNTSGAVTISRVNSLFSPLFYCLLERCLFWWNFFSWPYEVACDSSNSINNSIDQTKLYNFHCWLYGPSATQLKNNITSKRFKQPSRPLLSVRQMLISIAPYNNGALWHIDPNIFFIAL